MSSQLEKEVKNRIMMINEDLRRNLSSLDLEDSMSTEEYRSFNESEALSVELTAEQKALRLALKALKTGTESSLTINDEKLSLKVKQKDAVTELNVESGQLTFTTKKFYVDTPNFKVKDSGCYVNGTVYANTANIAGWTFANGTASGGTSATMEGGVLAAESATCKYVTAASFNLQDVDVSMSKAQWQVGSLSGKNTQFHGNMHLSQSYGEYHCNGLLESTNGDIFCVRLRLVSDSSYVKGLNTIYCDYAQAGSWSTSDERLKENIEDISDTQAAALMDLSPKAYKMIKTGHKAAGLIAQEALESKDALGSEAFIGEYGGYYTLNYDQLIPLMVKQIQNNLGKLERMQQDGESKLQS